MGLIKEGQIKLAKSEHPAALISQKKLQFSQNKKESINKVSQIIKT